MRMIKALWRRGRCNSDQIDPAFMQISLTLKEHGWIDAWLDPADGPREIGKPLFFQECEQRALNNPIEVLR